MKQISKSKPKWLATRIGGGNQFNEVSRILAAHNLHTVCESAKCPNRGECFESGTATFMILGDRCTRGCRFCAVSRDPHPLPPHPDEPRRIAAAIQALDISYAVITSVTRDDLLDGGAKQFHETVRAIKALPNAPLVELLIPDLSGKSLQTVLSSEPNVLAHNIEVVEPLSRGMRHARFTYSGSLSVLREIKQREPAIFTKSSIMLGLGETETDIIHSMQDLRDAAVDILVLGQYLRPTLDNTPVIEYVPLKRFERYTQKGLEMGFGFVAAHPLARTSYRAKEAYEQLTATRKMDGKKNKQGDSR